MPVNLVVDFAAGRFGETVVARAIAAAAARGYRLVHTACCNERLAAWIDWQFAPSWWSAEVRAGEVWYALDAHDEFAGFAALDVRGMRFPWLRDYERRRDVGIFGPLGVATEHRKSGLGTALLDAALGTLRARGYAGALIPAVGFDKLIAMYQVRTGAHIVDTYSYDSPRYYRATILASGGGTNAQHVFERVAGGQLPLIINAVITNSPAAGVLARAAAAGIVSHTVAWNRGAQTRAVYDRALLDVVAATEPELVLLLGWMHLLPPAFIERFPAILNVHPAFLPFDPQADDVTFPDGTSAPAFRGAHALRDALAGQTTWVGASVHRVTTEVDRGAIMVRTPLRINGASSVDAVAARLRPIEHAAVTAAIRRWIFERSA